MKLDQFLRESLPASTTTTQIKQKIADFELQFKPIPDSIKQSVPEEEVVLDLEDFLIVLKKVMAHHKVYSPSKLPPLQEHVVDEVGNISVLQSSFDVLSHSNMSLNVEKDLLNLENKSLEEQLKQFQDREAENLVEMGKLATRLQLISQAHYGITGELEDYKQMENKWLDDINTKQSEIQSLETVLFDHQLSIKALELEKDEYLQHIQQLEETIAKLEQSKKEKEKLATDNSKLNDELVELKSQFMQHPFTSYTAVNYADFKSLESLNDVPEGERLQLFKTVQIGILNEIRQFNIKINDLSGTISVKNSENEELQLLIQNMKDEQLLLNSAIDHQNYEIEDLKIKVKHGQALADENKHLNGQILQLKEKLQKMTEKLNLQITDKATMNYKLQQNVNDLGTQLTDLKTQKNTIQSTLQEKRKELKNIEKSILKTSQVEKHGNAKWLSFFIILGIVAILWTAANTAEFDDKWLKWMEYHLSKYQMDKIIIL